MRIIYDEILHKPRKGDKSSVTQVVVSGDYILQRNSDSIIVATGSGDILLPDPFIDGYFQIANVGTGTIRVVTNDSATPPREELAVLEPGQGCVVASDGSDWFLLNKITNGETDQLIISDPTNENIDHSPEKDNQSDLNKDFVTAINSRIAYTEVIDNLISTLTNRPLSANQGRELKAMIDAITSGTNFQGVWDADTNSPDITGETTNNDYWIVNVAGNTDLDGITTWEVGDWAIIDSGAFKRIPFSSIMTTETLPTTEPEESIDASNPDANQKEININAAEAIRELRSICAVDDIGILGSAWTDTSLLSSLKGTYIPSTDTKYSFEVDLQSINESILLADASNKRFSLGCTGIAVSWIFSLDYVIADANPYVVTITAMKEGGSQVGEARTITVDGSNSLTGTKYFKYSFFKEDELNSHIYFNIKCSAASKVTMNDIRGIIMAGDSVNFNYGNTAAWRADLDYKINDITTYDGIFYIAQVNITGNPSNQDPETDDTSWKKVQNRIEWRTVNADTNVEDNAGYFLDTSTGPIALVCPTTPYTGFRFQFIADGLDHAFTINPSGKKIYGTTETLEITINSFAGEVIYDGTEWKFASQIEEVNMAAAMPGGTGNPAIPFYSSTETYSTGELVGYLGEIYKSLVDNNTGNSPNLSPSEWALYVMKKSVYDPNDVEDDAFDMANMVESATKKILTVAERTAIASNTSDISDNADDITTANTKITALQKGNVDFFIAGKYADAADNELLWNDMTTKFVWRQSAGIITKINATHNVVDGTSQPAIAVRVDGTNSSTVTLGASGTFVSATLSIAVSPGDTIEIACTTAGGAGDAEDLTVSIEYTIN